MSIEKLERVMWRLRKKFPDQVSVTILELQRAIMYECGTDPTTYRSNKRALVRLGWIKARGNKRIDITGADITGDEL